MVAGVIFYILLAIGAAINVSSNNRSGSNGFTAGVLLGPIALLIVGFMAPSEARPKQVCREPPLQQLPSERARPSNPELTSTNQTKAIVCCFCH